MRRIMFLGLVAFTLQSSVALAWFSKGKDGACTDVGDMWTPETLSQKTNSRDCKKESQSSKKVVFNCTSKDMAIFNGVITIYPTITDCKSDGGTFNSKKYSEIKQEWATNYNSKLWFYVNDSCGKNRFECVLSNKTAKQSVLTIKDKLSSEGYSCSNNFDFIATTATPQSTLPMSIYCLKRVNMCSLAIDFFKTKDECEISLKNEKIKN